MGRLPSGLLPARPRSLPAVPTSVHRGEAPRHDFDAVWRAQKAKGVQRWHARRVRRTLVVTHEACKAAFQGIPGVETAHFNAIAGLDLWRAVDLIVLVGRLLPSDRALAKLAGALFDTVVEGGYRHATKGIAMRDGTVRAARVLQHEDEQAELLRAAISDDELIQAIGRGRGVNRTHETPLEVQVLADVALPLLHDHVLDWPLLKPDLMQRMLLGGIAVDSPADAACLHPQLLANEKQAQKAFERAGFKRHFPYKHSYRDLSLKSAAYRRPGRGRGWTRACWLDASHDEACRALTRALGALAAWVPAED